MQALWGEPWTARSVSIDGNEVVPFRGDVTDLWLLAKQCPVTLWRQGPVERRRNGGAAQGSLWLDRFDRRIRFLALVVFSVLSCTFSKDCRKKSVDQRPPKSKAEILTPIVNFLCVKVLRRVKKDRTLVKKFRSSLSQRAAEHPMQWERKQRTGAWALEPASFRKEIIVIQSQRKAKAQYGICAGFWFDRRGHKAKRSDARFIYILIPKTIGNRKRDCAWGGSGW